MSSTATGTRIHDPGSTFSVPSLYLYITTAISVIYSFHHTLLGSIFGYGPPQPPSYPGGRTYPGGGAPPDPPPGNFTSEDNRYDQERMDGAFLLFPRIDWDHIGEVVKATLVWISLIIPVLMAIYEFYYFRVGRSIEDSPPAGPQLGHEVSAPEGHTLPSMFRNGFDNALPWADSTFCETSTTASSEKVKNLSLSRIDLRGFRLTRSVAIVDTVTKSTGLGLRLVRTAPAEAEKKGTFETYQLAFEIQGRVAVLALEGVKSVVVRPIGDDVFEIGLMIVDNSRTQDSGVFSRLSATPLTLEAYPPRTALTSRQAFDRLKTEHLLSPLHGWQSVKTAASKSQGPARNIIDSVEEEKSRYPTLSPEMSAAACLVRFRAQFTEQSGLRPIIVQNILEEQLFEIHCMGMNGIAVSVYCTVYRNKFREMMNERKIHSSGQVFTTSTAAGGSQELRKIIRHFLDRIPRAYCTSFEESLISRNGLDSVSLDQVCEYVISRANVKATVTEQQTSGNGTSSEPESLNWMNKMTRGDSEEEQKEDEEKTPFDEQGWYNAMTFYPKNDRNAKLLVCEPVTEHTQPATMKKWYLCGDPNHMRGMHWASLAKADWSKEPRVCPVAECAGRKHPVSKDGEICCPNLLAKSAGRIVQRDGNTRMVYCDCLVDAKGRPFHPSFEKPHFKEGIQKEYKELMKDNKNPTCKFAKPHELKSFFPPDWVKSSKVRKPPGGKGKGKGSKYGGGGGKGGKGVQRKFDKMTKRLNKMTALLNAAKGGAPPAPAAGSGAGTGSAVDNNGNDWGLWEDVPLGVSMGNRMEIRESLDLHSEESSWCWTIFRIFLLFWSFLRILEHSLVEGAGYVAAPAPQLLSKMSRRFLHRNGIVSMMNACWKATANAAKEVRKTPIYIAGFLGNHLPLPLYLDPGAWLGYDIIDKGTYQKLRAREELAEFVSPPMPCSPVDISFGRKEFSHKADRECILALSIPTKSGRVLTLKRKFLIVEGLNTPGALIAGDTAVYQLGINYAPLREGKKEIQLLGEAVPIVEFNKQTSRPVMNSMTRLAHVAAFASIAATFVCPPINSSNTTAVVQPSLKASRDGLSFLPILVDGSEIDSTEHQIEIFNHRPKDREVAITREHIKIQPLSPHGREGFSNGMLASFEDDTTQAGGDVGTLPLPSSSSVGQSRKNFFSLGEGKRNKSSLGWKACMTMSALLHDYGLWEPLGSLLAENDTYRLSPFEGIDYDEGEVELGSRVCADVWRMNANATHEPDHISDWDRELFNFDESPVDVNSVKWDWYKWSRERAKERNQTGRPDFRGAKAWNATNKVTISEADVPKTRDFQHLSQLFREWESIRQVHGILNMAKYKNKQKPKDFNALDHEIEERMQKRAKNRKWDVPSPEWTANVVSVFEKQLAGFKHLTEDMKKTWLIWGIFLCPNTLKLVLNGLAKYKNRR